jgi:hypothetical protein
MIYSSCSLGGRFWPEWVTFPQREAPAQEAAAVLDCLNATG